MISASFLSVLLLLLCRACAALPDYAERLVIQPLVPASVLASFNFRSNASQSSYEQQHFQHFPRSLGQILQHAHAKELHLRFSTGRWDAESWGTRPWDGAKEGGTGVEIWGWLEADTEDEAFARWITLNNALAGLFCASMTCIDSPRTTRPVMTFEPFGDHSNSSMANLHLLHGSLPREVVCTENLTPFLKLLPCKGKAGIASLLDGHKLFDATWQTMSIDVRPVCPSDQQECIMEIEQTIDMVLDIERSKRPRDDPIPRPLPHDKLICDSSKQYPNGDSCYPLDLSETQGFTLKELFGRPIQGTCLGRQGSETAPPPICISAPESLDVFTVGGVTEHKDPSGLSRCLEIPEIGEFEMFITKQDPSRFLPVSTPPLYAERSITGHGQERGGVRILLTNPNPAQNVSFVYFEALPWFMKPYLHTLTPSIPGAISEMYYRPGLDRQRGSQLELAVTVPPASTLELAYDFEKAILRYTEYPPDANRGRDVAPAVVRLVDFASASAAADGSSLRLDASGQPSLSAPASRAMSGHDEKVAYIRTTPLMLPLPTPDFSMPYNVIILTSTVIALAFGTVYNMLVRQFIGTDEAEGSGPKEKIRALVARIRARFVKRDESEKKTL